MDEWIYCCKIKDESVSNEFTAELLTALDLEFSTWFNAEEHLSFHTVYCKNEAQARKVSEQLSELAPQWRELGCIIANPEVISLKKEDWAETWKQYFKVSQVSPRLDRKSTRLNSSHIPLSRMPSSA